jgi:hypothetical protein
MIEIYEQQALTIFQPARKEVSIYQKILKLKEITTKEITLKHWAKNKTESKKILEEMQKLGLGKVITSPRGVVTFERK